MFRIMWRAAGSVKLTFGLLVLIAANLGTGSYYVKYCPDVFRMLSHSLVQDWYAGQGRYHSGETWWLWTLLVLGFMLGINTTACTLSRVGGLWPKRK